jgi:hypothetical protein
MYENARNVKIPLILAYTAEVMAMIALLLVGDLAMNGTCLVVPISQNLNEF